MEKSEMEAPLLPQNDVEASQLRRSSAEPECEIQRCFSRKSVMIGIWLACSIGALLILGASHGRTYRSRSYEGVVVLDDTTDQSLDYYTAQHTSFHFQPPKNFMSDPCAPMYWNGYYHLWYQWNPYGRVWGNMSWGHTVSVDLIHWEFLELSLVPSEWYDFQGVWSGYATIVDGNPLVLYTGGRGLVGGEANQSISMAVPADPSDPLLRDWVKVEGNPLIYTPEGMSSQAFRDPTTGWLETGDTLWRISIPSVVIHEDQTRDGTGLMYTSTDFKHWTLEETHLHSVKGTGTWECLDLFPTFTEDQLGKGTPLNPEYYHDSEESGLRYVLKAGMDEVRLDYYALGTYSTKTHTWTPDDPELDVGIGLKYDYGKFYAAKTFYDTSKNRRVLWGYVHESDSEADDIIKGWACLQSIPRTIWLDGKTGKNVLQWPVEEVETLRGAHVSYSDIELQPEEVKKVDGIGGQQLDISVSFEKPIVSSIGGPKFVPDKEFDCKAGADNRGVLGPFGLIVLADEQRIEHSDIFFYLAQKSTGEWGTLVCSDQSRSTLNDDGIDKTVYYNYLEVVESDEELSLRVLVDHSIVETFVQGGRFAITARAYPTIAFGSAAKVFLFNNGTTPIKVKSLVVYEIASVAMNFVDES